MTDPVYFYQWQNPVLLEDIYPFRQVKLVDFLAVFEEARIWKEYQEKGIEHQEIQADLTAIQSKMHQRRERVVQELHAAVQDRLATDPYFGVVTSDDEDGLRRKRIYYLGRILRLAESKAGEIEYARNRSLKKAQWDWSGAADPEAMKQRYLDAAAQAETDLLQVNREIKKIENFLRLYEQEEQLPEPDDQLTLAAAALFKVELFRSEHIGTNQHELLQLILDTHFDASKPDSYWLNLILPYPSDPTNKLTWKELIKGPNGEVSRWLEYMLIHFSGMRYKSAHGSWADPCYLLQLLETAQIEDELDAIQKNAPDQIRLFCGQTLQELAKNQVAEIARERVRTGKVELEKALAGEITLEETRTAKIAEIETADKDARSKYLKLLKFLNYYITRLKWQFCLTHLKRYRAAIKVTEIEEANEKAKDSVLDLLLAFKERKEQEGDPIPNWAWAEMVKYTRLRTQLAEKDWERYDPQRWKWENRRWHRILVAWESKDITSWREHHHKTLDLIVTRAVCNEISEHIQHIRGLKPAGGLTAKTEWFYKTSRQLNPDGDPTGPFFRQAFHLADFIPGASIFWADWQERQPTQWQMVVPFGPFEFLPIGSRLKSDGFARLDPDKWTYQRWKGGYKRTRRQLKRNELKRMGKSKAEIDQILAQQSGPIVEYLRWTHEAIVVGTVELINGRYVLTFETGKTGLNQRWFNYLVYNPNVFVGYLPDKDLPAELKQNLNEALDRVKVLSLAPNQG